MSGWLCQIYRHFLIFCFRLLPYILHDFATPYKSNYGPEVKR